jgi:hypothetical protein
MRSIRASSPRPNLSGWVRNLDRLAEQLAGRDGVIVRLAIGEIDRCRALTVAINESETEITRLVAPLAPIPLLLVVGVGAVPDGRLVGETTGADRFR